MDEAGSPSHTKWQCKYHVVFIPKCRRKTLYRQLRRYLGEVFRGLAAQKESRMYARITSSSRPTVDTKYPRAQKCCPTKFRLRSPYTRAR